MAGIERAAVDKGQLNGKTIVWVMGNLRNWNWYAVLLVEYTCIKIKGFFILLIRVNLKLSNKVALEVEEELSAKKFAWNTETSSISVLEIWWKLKLCPDLPEEQSFINWCRQVKQYQMKL